MTSDTQVMTKEVSWANIEASIAQFLYATGYANDNDEVTNMQLGAITKEGLVPLTFTVRRKQEVN